MTNKRAWGKRLMAATGVVAVTVTGLVGTAFAADGVGEVVYNLDTTKTVSVTIEKHKGDEGAARSDGTVKTVNGEKLGGVKFGLSPVLCKLASEADSTYAKINLKTDEGWRRAADVKLKADGTGIEMKASSKYACKLDTEAETDATNGTTGQVSYTGDWTLYYVRETTAPNTVVITKKTEPFLLTLPLVYPGDTTNQAGWIYNPIVYPKNSTKTSTNSKSGKLVDSGETKDLVLSDGGNLVTGNRVVEWTIVVTVPSRANYTAFHVNDPLAEALSYDTAKGASVSISGVKDASATDVKTARGLSVEAQHCDVADTTWTCAGAATATSRNIRLNVTPAANLKAGDEITIALRTVIDPTKVTSESSGVENDKAKAYVNNETTTITGDDGPLKPPPGPGGCDNCKPAQNYGLATLKKIDAANSAKADPKGLEGAEFDLYAVVPEGDARAKVDTTTLPTSLQSKVTAGNKLVKLPATQQKSVFTTDSKGQIDLKLFLGNNDDKNAVYFLHETKAPLGYITPEATADAAWQTLEFQDGVLQGTTDSVIKFSNTASTTAVIPGGLPLTGAQGLMLLTLGGGALILVGIGIMLVIRRRQAEEA